MTKSELKIGIEKILRSYFVDADEKNSWGTPERVANIMQLIARHEKQIPCCGHPCCCNLTTTREEKE